MTNGERDRGLLAGECGSRLLERQSQLDHVPIALGRHLAETARHHLCDLRRGLDWLGLGAAHGVDDVRHTVCLERTTPPSIS